MNSGYQDELDDILGNKKPKEAQQNLTQKKGIDLFFGELEAKFMDQLGKEMVVNILKESFILYRIDLKRTKSHALYGEAFKKEYKEQIEVFGRINVEVDDPSYRAGGRGVTKQGMGQLTCGLHLSHLEELGLLTKRNGVISIDMKKGDFLSHKGQFYEIWDDGYSQISNQHSMAGDRRSFLTIRAKEVDRDVFNGA